MEEGTRVFTHEPCWMLLCQGIVYMCVHTQIYTLPETRLLRVGVWANMPIYLPDVTGLGSGMWPTTLDTPPT